MQSSRANRLAEYLRILRKELSELAVTEKELEYMKRMSKEDALYITERLQETNARQKCVADAIVDLECELGELYEY